MNSASSAARFRLPVQPPVRHLLIASMSALVGSIEVIAWAMFRLPEFVLAAGLAHRGWRRLRGCRPGQVPVTEMGGISVRRITVAYRTRRREVAWSDIASVRLVSGRLLVLAPDGSGLLVLPIDRTSSAQKAAAEVVREIDVRLSTHMT